MTTSKNDNENEALDEFFRDALNTELFGSADDSQPDQSEEASVQQPDDQLQSEPQLATDAQPDAQDNSSAPANSASDAAESESKQSASAGVEAISELTLPLPESIDIDNFDELRCQWSDIAWGSVERITLDAEDLEDICFQGLQLLSSLNKTCSEKNVQMIWENIPIPLFQISEELGMSDALGL